MDRIRSDLDYWDCHHPVPDEAGFLMSEASSAPLEPTEEQERRDLEEKVIPGQFAIKLRRSLQLPRKPTHKRPTE